MRLPGFPVVWGRCLNSHPSPPNCAPLPSAGPGGSSKLDTDTGLASALDTHPIVVTQELV